MELNQIGVTPRKEAQFKKRGIESVEDLLRCYPKEYRDYRVPVSVRTLKDRQDERAAVLGIVTGCRILQGKHAMVRLKDKDGGNISAVWFNQAFRVRQVVLGGSYIVGGMARWDEQYQSVSFLMPDLFESFEGFRFGIKPVYRKIPGMSEEYFSSVMEEALSHIDDMGDYLNDEECKALDVPNTADTFRLAHLPESMEDVRRAQRRVLVDNMYPFCREMEMKRMQAAAESPFVPLAAFETMEQIRTFLPYQLTEDQKNALRRMLHEMKTGKRLDVLLQGDVGCGKTIVAIILAACMSKSGYQTAVVCPTSVLAGQHLQAFRSLLGKLDIKVAYLQGGMKAAERRALLKEVKSGAAGVVIGTHALFSPDVEFKALGLMIIDEEHRFGVKQKEALRGKAAQGVHSVSMSATPIPRSIAVAMYGEGTEVVNIRTLPNGRKPVKTILYSNEEKVYQSMMNQIGTGHQCYVVGQRYVVGCGFCRDDHAENDRVVWQISAGADRGADGRDEAGTDDSGNRPVCSRADAYPRFHDRRGGRRQCAKRYGHAHQKRGTVWPCAAASVAGPGRQKRFAELLCAAVGQDRQRTAEHDDGHERRL